MRAEGLLAVVGSIVALGCGRVGFDDSQSSGELSIVETVINDGSASTNIFPLAIHVDVQGGVPPVEVQFAEAHLFTGECVRRDSAWRPYVPPPATQLFFPAPIHLPKKICVWARDSVGSITTMASPGGSPGVDTDSIGYDGGKAPVVTSFTVTNAEPGTRLGTSSYLAGESVEIAWSVTDDQPFTHGSVDLFVTTDGNTWTAITTDYDTGLDSSSMTYTGTYTNFVAPSAQFFRVKLVVRDTNNNASIPAISDAQNTPNWSVYMGGHDRGEYESGSGILLGQGGSRPHRFALDPIRGGIAVVDSHLHGSFDGFRKGAVLYLDPTSGQFEILLREADNTNLPDDGPLPSNPVYGEGAQLQFDSLGRLYVLNEATGGYRSGRAIYQIDLTTRHVRRYAGGGSMTPAGGIAATDLEVSPGAMAFDEQNTLYFLANCTPGQFTSASTVRIMKVLQNSDGTPGDVSQIAGNCVRGTPNVDPGDPLTMPLHGTPNVDLSTIAVWNNGARLFYRFYTGQARKIIDGVSFPSSVDTSNSANMAYDPTTKRIYAANGSIDAYDIDEAGNEGPPTTIVSNLGSSRNCVADGVSAVSACVNVEYTIAADSSGRIFFGDGANHNGVRDFRIRHLTQENTVRTVAGTLPFEGEGRHRRLIRGSIGGIAYKQPTDPNQAAFPAGLYFVDYSAVVLGRVRSGTNEVELLWGNQSGVGVDYYPEGTLISADLSLGSSHFGGTMTGLALDGNGLPWLRYQARLTRLDSQRRVVELQAATTSANWSAVVEGTDPSVYRTGSYGLSSNIAVTNDGAFFLGAEASSEPASIAYFNYNSLTGSSRIMGTFPEGISPDNPVPGALPGLSLSQDCRAFGPCYIVYHPGQDRLYFGEEGRIRYIESPTNPASATLHTLVDLSLGGDVNNFTFRPTGDMLFYSRNDGQLYCYDLSSGAPWCDDTPLGPPTGLRPIRRGANQFTWVDSQTLLISNYQGEVYQYSLPP